MERRKAMFAGSWYPAQAAACEREIENFLREGQEKLVSDREWVGGVVPHAGWYYSGSVACNVIRRLGPQKPPDAVVIFGMHLHSHSAACIMTEGAWETPFGDLPVERDLARDLSGRFDFKVETPASFPRDNTIELQLPFIRYFFKDSRIVPVGVPPNAQALDIGRAAVECAVRRGLQIKVLGSTDLTHYGTNYGFTPQGGGRGALAWVREDNDRKIIDAMLALDPEAVLSEAERNQNACCAGAAAAAIAAGKALGSSGAESIAYATSHDKSPGESFVGYVGILF
jgi:AmmeMemoRadiSam system protein B